MVQIRTVLKVDISCQKCKKKILKAVSTIEGVDKIEVDMEKGMVTITGDGDPYEIVVSIRKAGKHAEVVSVGPPPPPPKPQQPEGQKKDDGKKLEDKKSDQDTKKKGDDQKSQPQQKQQQQQQQPQLQQQHQPYNVQPNFHDPHSCPQCQRVVYVPMGRYYEPTPSCSIM